jgi:hypothetical protein
VGEEVGDVEGILVGTLLLKASVVVPVADNTCESGMTTTE